MTTTTSASASHDAGNGTSGAPRTHSPLALACGRFARNRAALASLALLALVILACYAGPPLIGRDPTESDWSAIAVAPTLLGGHWFGTDELGRDLLVRTLIGGRISIQIGILGTLVAGGVGVTYGACAG
jgi:oligopeptide transport system permease protein